LKPSRRPSSKPSLLPPVNATNFTVTVSPGPGGGPSPTFPLPPTLTVGISLGVEDGFITVNVTAMAAVGDTTNPGIAVQISNLPVGATVLGATLNVVTGRYTASAADVNAGRVKIIPPKDFSGALNVTVEAVATNLFGLHSSSGPQNLPSFVDPVADGPSIALSPSSGTEDVVIPVVITVGEIDIDSSENIGSFTYILLSDGATLTGPSSPYPFVLAGDVDATVVTTSVVGYSRVPTADLASSLGVLPAMNWHGTFTITVVATTVEPLDNNDGDNIAAHTAMFAVAVAANADPPLLTVNNAVGVEDTRITLNLTATLVDNVATNGAELLSALITNVPLGTIFSAGSNNGDGSWTILPTALAGLTVLPPRNFAGTMSLNLVGISLELSNGDDANSTLPFVVTVAPKADSFLVLANDVVLDNTNSASALLVLNVRDADSRGTEPGEIGAEILTFTFSNVPTGVFLFASMGGKIIDSTGGMWTFIGTEAQANMIRVVSGFGTVTGTSTVSFSAISRDGTDVLPTAVTDVFRLTVTAPTNAGVSLVSAPFTGGLGNDLLTGTAGNDVMSGGAGFDRLIGGPGVDTMTGGAGADLFVWQSGDLGVGTDSITDFSPSVWRRFGPECTATGLQPTDIAPVEFRATRTQCW
jgi:large repetitive protein